MFEGILDGGGGGEEGSSRADNNLNCSDSREPKVAR